MGLIGIGKPWGHADATVPGEAEVRSLLERAFTLGVRYFDTAPSYGVSEQRLGDFLSTMTAEDRDSLTLATKFGEHWDAARGEPFVDHSREALCRSLDASLGRLGRIDILQLHKTAPGVLESADLAHAWEYAESLGIRRIGASVSDALSAELVVGGPRYSVLQLPYNLEARQFEFAIDTAAARGLDVAVNRPFGMGSLLYGDHAVSKVEAFAFILRRRFRGVILSGTKSAEHLEENLRAFREAMARVSGNC